MYPAIPTPGNMALSTPSKKCKKAWARMVPDRRWVHTEQQRDHLSFAWLCRIRQQLRSLKTVPIPTPTSTTAARRLSSR